MTIQELQEKYSKGLKPHEADLLQRYQEELEGAGFVDKSGKPTGPGVYIVPLFLFVQEASSEIANAWAEHLADPCEGGEGESVEDVQKLCKDFGNLLTDTIRRLREEENEEAEDLVMGFIIPYMGPLFACQFVWVQTEMRFIDIIEKDPSVEPGFNSDRLNDASFKAIAIYRSLAAEDGDQWAVMIADHAKMFFGDGAGTAATAEDESQIPIVAPEKSLGEADSEEDSDRASLRVADDGLLRDLKESKPFSGRADSMYASGNIHQQGSYKDGKPDGLNKEYYENGQKKFEGTYKDGKRDGPTTQYYENGQKQLEGAFKNDEPDGHSRFWHENGQKGAEITYENGEMNGPSICWHVENGQKAEESIYKHGKLVSAKYWNIKGEEVDTWEESNE